MPFPGHFSAVINNRTHAKLIAMLGNERVSHFASLAKYGACQKFCARGRFSSLDDEPFAEDHGELGLCLGPFARRSFPLPGRVIEDEV
jgi:hypothetical protein